METEEQLKATKEEAIRKFEKFIFPELRRNMCRINR